MKKKISSIVLLTLTLLSSCTKEFKDEIIPKNPKKVKLEISIPQVTTKSGTESSVESLQIYVFKKDGKLDAYAKFTDDSRTLSCTTGEKDIVAIVNAPDISNVANKVALQNNLSALEDNTPTALVMYGEINKNIRVDSNIEIPVTRLAARISIKKITKNFTSTYYQNKQMMVTNIFLVNAVGSVKYSGETDPTTWYNKGKYISNPADDLLYENINKVVSNGSTLTQTYSFYTYPNPTTTETGENKFTRLAVEVTLDSKTYYYPITIEGIQSNHTYDITELIITRLGSDSPDIPVSSTDATFNISVKEWIEGSSTTETI